MTTLNTPTGIEYAQYAFLKAGLRMESVGMKTRGGALRPKHAKLLGLSPRAPYADFINAVKVRMNELLEQAKEESLNAANDPACN